MQMTHDSPGKTFISTFKMPSAWDLVYSINMGVACVIAYAITTSILVPVARDDDLLGGMWAAVAAVFVFRDTRAHSLSAGLARFIATCVSFALCWLYMTILPPTAIAIPVLVTLGALVMMLLNRREDIITAAITTIVVMVVAIISPAHARAQPLLRLFDTVVGIGIGVACKWTASVVFSALRRDADS
jgi:uncharacterized membrane protein YgaE (UPF0421/DUF939 family)